MSAESRKHRKVFPADPAKHRGRKTKFDTRIERQVSVGLDSLRLQQLLAVQEHLSSSSIGEEITASGVMRYSFDKLVASLRKEVPELNIPQ